MKAFNFRMAAALFAFGVLALSANFSAEARAQEMAVDPAATKILKRMTDYLGSSIHRQCAFSSPKIPIHTLDCVTPGVKKMN